MTGETHGSILVDVKLHELDLSRKGSVDNLVEGARSEGRNHLDDTGLMAGATRNQRAYPGTKAETDLSSSPSQILFSIGVTQLSEGSSGTVDRCNGKSEFVIVVLLSSETNLRRAVCRKEGQQTVDGNLSDSVQRDRESWRSNRCW